MPGPCIILAPYDSGRMRYRMGAGPEALVAGVVATLSEPALVVSTVAAPVTLDVRAHSIALAGAVSSEVARARAQGRFPLVLAGNCFNTIGALAGIGTDDVAVVWLDAHGDLNTPETSPSGFLDGMAAATLLGWCLETDAETIPGFAPLASSRFTLAGARALDPAEAHALEAHQIRRLPAATMKRDLLAHHLIADITAGARHSYIHLDLDVLDPAAVGPANSFATADGVSAEDVIRLVTALGEKTVIAGMTVSAYDPAIDQTGAVARAAIRIADVVCAIARR